MSKHYKKPIKRHIKDQTKFKTKEKAKKTPFKMKKFCHTNLMQYHYYQNQANPLMRYDKSSTDIGFRYRFSSV